MELTGEILLDKILIQYDWSSRNLDYRIHPSASLIKQIDKMLFFYDAFDEEDKVKP